MTACTCSSRNPYLESVRVCVYYIYIIHTHIYFVLFVYFWLSWVFTATRALFELWRLGAAV